MSNRNPCSRNAASAAAFYVTYWVMSWKSKLSASLNDIRVLSALELRLVRALVA